MINQKPKKKRRKNKNGERERAKERTKRVWAVSEVHTKLVKFLRSLE